MAGQVVGEPMGEMWGADLAQLRSLAREFDAASQSLDNTVSQVTSVLAGVDWLGPSGDQFREEWDGHHAPALRLAATGLAEARITVERNADDQERTSEDYAGGGSVGGPAGGGISTQEAGGGGGGGTWNPEDDGFPEWFDEGLAGWANGLTAAGLGQDLINLIAKVGSGVDALSDLGPGGHMLDAFGKFFAVGSIVTGGLQAYDEWSEGDFYGGADGAITAGLGVAVLATAATPAGPFVAAGAAAWGAASLINGLVSDRPLSENLVNMSPVGLAWNAFSDKQFSEAVTDAGGWAWDRGTEAVSEIAEDAGDVFEAGGNMLKGAGNAIGGLFD
jgi:uncharacterized protein YukE